jgi:methyltransferase (TIGR00027 family)
MSECAAPGSTGGIVCRTRYIDEVLQHCVEAGITTIISLGAGLDTRALRVPGLSHVTYYEVDHADVLTYKQAKIVAFQGSVPRHLRFLPVNVQHESVEDRLQAEGWHDTDRTLFIVEGVIQYITSEAFHALLTLVSHAAEESHLVLTYPMQDFLDGTKDYGKIHRLLTYARYLGITSYNGLLPDTLPPILGPYSLEVLHDVGAEDYQQSFLHALNRNLDVWDIERVAWACLRRKK